MIDDTWKKTKKGRRVYKYRSKPFILPRLLKIMIQLFNKFPRRDPVLDPGEEIFKRQAPTSTIFAIWTLSTEWLQTRGEWEAIFTQNLEPRLENLRVSRRNVPPEEWRLILENFYQWFDVAVNFVEAGLKKLNELAPVLGPILSLDTALISLYRKVRQEFPIL